MTLTRTGEDPGDERPPNGVAHVAPASVNPFQPGTTIDLGGTRYELVRLLGRGGMADVFLARRHGGSGFVREVALKVITADLEEEELFRKMFVAETQLANRLCHRGIPEAYDLQQLGGRYCLVLEYVAGVSARSVIQAARRRQRSLSEGLCCHVVASVADALHYAHGVTDDDGRPLGIVHRDVKAANVMIATSGGVKLLDFGIAYARLNGRERTETGLQKGTSAYLSPEQALGEPLDGRSDLFALGILLGELLTGERVFGAESDQATVRKIIECNPVDVQAVTARMAPGLRGICDRAIAKKRADRFQNGAEFSRALRGYLLEQRILYVEEDCAAEVRSVEVSGSGEPVMAGVTQLTETAGRGVLRTVFGTKESGRRNAMPRRLVLFFAVAVVGAALVAGAMAMWHRSASPPGTLPGLAPESAAELRANTAPTADAVSPAPGTTPVAPTAEEQQPTPVPQASTVIPAPAPASSSVLETMATETRTTGARPASGAGSPPVVLEGPVVRAKKRKAKSEMPEAGPAESTKGMKPVSTRQVPTETLARGTLIRAQLTSTLNAFTTGPVEAIVTEDVSSDGGDVPRGSKILCLSRIAKEGRVGILCDSIKAGDRTWSFSGIGVGEGAHVGLPVVDRRVPSGTSFEVYVSASALR